MFLVLLGFFAPSARAANEVGPEGSHYLVYDFTNDWLVYSSQYNNYIPYSSALNETDLSVSLLVDLLKNRRYDLLISTSKENYLFVEGALQKKLTPDEWLVLSVDSLRKLYKKDEILLTLYGSAGKEDKTVLIGHAKRTTATPGTTAKSSPLSFINIKPLRTSPFGDFSVLLILLLLVLTLFTYAGSPSLFRRFITPADFFDRSERNDLYRFNRPYGRFMFMIALIVSMAIGYLILFLAHYGFDLFATSGFLSDGTTLTDFLTDSAKLTFLFLGLLFLKFIMMEIVSGVLNLDRIVNSHYIRALQLSYIFYGVCIIVFFGISLQNPLWFRQLGPYLLYIAIFYYLARFGLLYIFTNSSGQFINLYLFSYLCVIEIIPLIVGVKFAN
ncbi:DUF4271 domain-containing protein [Salmonirosea aquatica]